MLRGPLAGRYSAVAAMVMFALIPCLALSAALDPLTPTVLAVQFAQHLPQRRMMVIYAVLLTIGSVLAASAVNAQMYIVGHVIQGLCTSLLLIAAVPPLAIGYPANKLLVTAVILNMCVFSAWRWVRSSAVWGRRRMPGARLFWIIAAIAAVALALTL